MPRKEIFVIPGETITKVGGITINAELKEIEIEVANSGDRPVQIGSHYHFSEVCDALVFNRDKTVGFRLNIAAGTATRFEPGQTRTVTLVPYQGKREVYGFSGKIMGELTSCLP